MNVSVAVDDLIRMPQFQMTYEEKKHLLVPLLVEQAKACRASISAYDKYIRQMGFPLDQAVSYTDVPYLPVSVFKQFDLRTIPEDQVVRVLRSSATTTGTPSRVYLDKTTVLRQSRGLAAIVMDVLGKQRRPFLVLDCKEINQPGMDLSARGAAVRGLIPFASTVTYGLLSQGDGLEPDVSAIERFFEEHAGRNVLLFGFTYIVWINVIQKLRTRGVRFDHPQLTLLHSGGWKRLTEMKVEKERFARGVAEVFGCDPMNVRDFYGMVEQVGVIFIDCEVGHKHTPTFAEVAIRDFLSLEQVPVGGSGLIEVLSALPTSYPGHGLLTEDVGTLLGYDDCPCGRKGLYFRFRSRVEQVEVRGCGDTFAVSQQWKPRVQSPVPPLRTKSTGGLDVLVYDKPLTIQPDAAKFTLLRRQLLADMGTFAKLPVELIVQLLDSTARQMTTSEFRGIEGIAFLSTWMRKRNLERVLRQNLGTNVEALDKAIEVDKGLQLRAAPRGLVCHWVAGNVPTLAMFSWVMAILAKNASIVRVSRSSVQAVRTLFQAVERAHVEYQGQVYGGKTLLERTCVVHYPSDDATLNEAMSLVADARVVWGGSEAVRAITQLPRLEHCEDVIFGPKFSLSVADVATLTNPAAREKLVHNLVRDVLIFDQGACSSPQVLYVEGSLDEISELVDMLDAEFTAANRRTPKQQISETTAANIIRVRAEYGLSDEHLVRAPLDTSYSILLKQGVDLPDAIQSRTLFVRSVEDALDIVPLLSPKIQTIGVAISDDAKRMAFTEAAAVSGVSRCVPLGTMNFYDMPWDGMLPVSRLVRWSRV